MKNLCYDPTIYRGEEGFSEHKVALATEIRAEAQVLLSVCVPILKDGVTSLTHICPLRNLSL